MKFSENAQAAAAEYMREAKLPKTFSKDNVTQFKLLLAYMFHMELEGVKRSDLDKKDMERLLDVEVLKVHVNDSLFKECLKNARLVKVGKAIKAKSKSKKSKHKHKHDTVVYVKRRSHAAKFVDDIKEKFMNGALGLSIWVNDVLNGI